MKRFLIAAAVLGLGAPAMAGGIEGGVKNAYFNNFSSETVNYGERHINVDSYSEVSWEGETESHKEFHDFMGKLTGVDGSYENSESSFIEASYDSNSGGGCRRHCHGGGGSDFEIEGGAESAEAFEVSFEDPKVQLTWSNGYTNTSMWAEGYDEVSTEVEIYEEYEGYSETNEHGHEATSFASAF